MNIIDYVKEWGQYSLFEKPFNEVDSLVLCQLVYLHYGKFVPGLDRRSTPVSIQEIYEHPDRDRIWTIIGIVKIIKNCLQRWLLQDDLGA